MHDVGAHSTMYNYNMVQQGRYSVTRWIAMSTRLEKWSHDRSFDVIDTAVFIVYILEELWINSPL